MRANKRLHPCRLSMNTGLVGVMCSVADQLLGFFSFGDETTLTGVYRCRPQFIRRVIVSYMNERNRRLWCSSLQSECTFASLSTVDAYEFLTARGPSDTVSL